MFIAMNRFQVIPGEESAFQQVWRSRDTHLDGVEDSSSSTCCGGEAQEDHTLFSSRFEGLEVIQTVKPDAVAPAPATSV
jgi:heme-degrading monooxygenase HmoA